MKNEKQKTKMVVTFAIITTLLLSGIYFVAFKILQTKKEQVSVVSLELENYLNRDGAINTLKKVVKNTEVERSKLESYFVHFDDMPDFAKSLETMGKIAGVSFEIRRFKPAGNIFSFEISSEGSFRNTLHLITLIENMPFKVEFKKAYINIRESKDGESSKVWDGNFDIELVGFIGK